MLYPVSKLAFAMNSKIDVLVLGSSPTGLYVLREAAQCGLRVGLVDTVRGCAFYSRYASKSFLIRPDEIFEWISANLIEKSPLLIPTSDAWVEAISTLMLSKNNSLLSFQAYQGGAPPLLDKIRFHALCSHHGIETPGVWQAEGKNELRELGGSIPYPCILKPALIHKARLYLKGRKVLLARNEDEFAMHVSAMPQGLGGWMVQEIIPGRESEITLFGGYIARDGTPMEVFTGRKLRQYPAGFGSASLVVSANCKETRDLTLKFLRDINFHGIFGAEYKRDPRDGRLKMIEINPRPTLWFQAANDAGCRIVGAAVRDIRDEESVISSGVRKDVCWRYLFKDIASKVFYSRTKDFIFPPPDVRADHLSFVRSWPVFRFSDPLPAMFEPLGFLKKALERH